MFVQEEQFLWIWEMGKLEGSEEVEIVLRKHWRKLGSKEKGKEVEKNPEKGLEVVPEADVDMTLQ